MANKKFSDFTLKTDPANVDFLVGYLGSDNVRIDPDNIVADDSIGPDQLADTAVTAGSYTAADIPLMHKVVLRQRQMALVAVVVQQT